jgi:adenylate cyclase
LPSPDKPSIAVLPFANLSGDPEQEYFADGMVEEIITALSRIPRLLVIARNSSFTYKGQAIDVKQVGRELGARYVLEGSVRKASSRVRIAGQLIDAETGAHLWADRSTARSKMFSICRTRWRRASRGSSNRHCKRPRPPARRAAGQVI